MLFSITLDTRGQCNAPAVLPVWRTDIQYPCIRRWMCCRSFMVAFAGERNHLSLTRIEQRFLEFRTHSVATVPTELLRLACNVLLRLRDASCFVNVTSSRFMWILKINFHLTV